MVSRDNYVHLYAIAVAILVLLLAAFFGVRTGNGPAAVVVSVVFNGIVFGGAHLYLALRGEDGMVPTDARWRFVGFLSVVLGSVALSQYAGESSVGPVSLNALLLAVVVLVGVAYLATETIAAYRDARPEPAEQ